MSEKKSGSNLWLWCGSFSIAIALVVGAWWFSPGRQATIPPDRAESTASATRPGAPVAAQAVSPPAAAPGAESKRIAVAHGGPGSHFQKNTPRITAPNTPQAAQDRYDHSPVVKTAETSDGQGGLKRTKIYKTDMKYPLIRVDETYARDASGQSKLVARTEMVADHVMLKLAPGYTETDLSRAVQSIGASVLRSMPQANIYLVNFDISQNPRALDQVLQALRGSKMVQTTEPDFVMHVD